MRMNNSVTRILAVAALLAWVPNLSAVNITYNLQSYNAAQGGATLSGSITTDGSGGTLTAAKILGWQFTITTLTDTFTGSSANAGATATVTGGHVIADAAQIYMPITGNTSNRSLLLKDLITGNEIFWSRYPFGDSYQAKHNSTFIWNQSNAFSNGGLALPTFDAMVVAVLAPPAAIIPEPASIALLCSGLLALVGYRSRERDRSAVKMA